MTVTVEYTVEAGGHSEETATGVVSAGLVPTGVVPAGAVSTGLVSTGVEAETTGVLDSDEAT